MRSKEILLHNIQAFENKIDELNGLINKLEESRDALREQLRTLERVENTRNFLDRIHEANAENSMHAFLHSTTATTSIMDEFYNSDKEFLIIDGDVWLGNARVITSYKAVNLVISKARASIVFEKSRMTMTDLKKNFNPVFLVAPKSYEYITKDNRCYQLILELCRFCNKPLDKGRAYAFSKPVVLNAQTYRNQTGYGWEWRDGSVVWQGTEYGETTRFFILGFIAQ